MCMLRKENDKKTISYEISAMSHILVFALILATGVLGFGESAMAEEYDIGGGNNDYDTMFDLTSSIILQAGDVVNIYPGIYTDEWRLTNAVGTEDNPIIIRGVDASGNPITKPEETAIFDFSGISWPLPWGESAAIQLSGSSRWMILEGLALENFPDTKSGSALMRKVTR